MTISQACSRRRSLARKLTPSETNVSSATSRLITLVTTLRSLTTMLTTRVCLMSTTERSTGRLSHPSSTISTTTVETKQPLMRTTGARLIQDTKSVSTWMLTVVSILLSTEPLSFSLSLMRWSQGSLVRSVRAREREDAVDRMVLMNTITSIRSQTLPKIQLMCPPTSR